MAEMVQINLRAGAEQKTRWEDYLEESNRFASMSELIRASVEAEISQDSSDPQERPPALESDIAQLQQELTDVRKNVAWLRDHFQEGADVSELAQAVFNELELLPEQENPGQAPPEWDGDQESYEAHLRARGVVESNDPMQENHPQTAQALADRLEATPSRIEDAIEHLQDQFMPVVAIEYDGDTHYFKEE